MQYPATLRTSQPVQVMRFLDGSDQRWLAGLMPLREWLIQLQLLTEQELHALADFFRDQQGDYSPFIFPDPFSGLPVPNCRFKEPKFAGAYLASDIGSTSFWVIETNG